MSTIPAFRVWDPRDRRYLPVGSYALHADGYLIRTLGPQILGETRLSGEGWPLAERCSGIQAKDGTWLYDGDIVDGTDQESWETPPYECRMVVRWNEDRLCWEAWDPFCNQAWELSDYGPLDYVVGNIHENPGLIGPPEEDRE